MDTQYLASILLPLYRAEGDRDRSMRKDATDAYYKNYEQTGRLICSVASLILAVGFRLGAIASWPRQSIEEAPDRLALK